MVVNQHSSCALLTDLLEEQDRNFPAWSQKLADEIKDQLDRIVGYFEQLRKSSLWSPDAGLINHAAAMQDQAIFLCGSMKSGTTLLLELLDGHSQLNVLPGDSWLWVRFSDIAKKEVFSIQGWRDHWLRRVINPTGQAPFWILGHHQEKYVEFLEYMDYWFDTLPVDARRPALTTVLSYFCSNPHRSFDTVKWVEKTPGNEFRVLSLINNFPHAKFIHIVRDPRENLSSIKRLYQMRNWTWSARGIARSIADSLEAAHDNRRRLGTTRYLVVRYEDLTSDPEAVMHMIADFLLISWKDSLLLPTVNTQLANANSMYEDRQATGMVRQSQADKWRHELTVFEQGVIHQTRDRARKVGLDWELKFSDICKKVIFGWTINGITPGSRRAADINA